MKKFITSLLVLLLCTGVAFAQSFVIRRPIVAAGGGGGGGPTYINEYETAWNNATSPKQTSSFDVLANDVLVAYSIAEDTAATLGVAGGSLTWTEQQAIDTTQQCEVRIWTATVDSNKNMSVTFTNSGTSKYFGGNVIHFRDSGGVGASAQEYGIDGGSGTEPSLSITTTAANSSIVVANGDWNALDGSSRTWRTGDAGAFTERSYSYNSSNYTIYGGFHEDAGSTGAKAVGLSVPVSQSYAIVGVEVKGD